MIRFDQIAALGYEAYCKSVGWKSVRGEAYPSGKHCPNESKRLGSRLPIRSSMPIWRR